ncbi:MAG: hypothetical protein J1F71_04720 [Clostridiales bacterium]|nr:hypothetical protein [Clostridiales bacterium]
MSITKKQIAVITALNIVIAGLIAVIFFLRTPRLAESDASEKPDDGVVDVVTPPHEKLRGPSKGKVKEISYETRLMGSGDDSIVFSFSSGGVTYIFGNASVPGYDFDASGGFMCRIGADGKILGFTYFDGKMTAAGVIDGGFGVATVADAAEDGEKSTLFSVSEEGEIKELSDLDGTAVDIMSVGSKKISVVTTIGAGTVKLVEYTRAGDGWAVGKSTRISSALNIQYFDCYVSGDGYVISARAYSSPRYDAIVFYTFMAGGDAVPHYYGGNDESMLRPYAVLPYSGGYMAVCEKSGEAAIVTVDYGFSSYRRDMLSFKFTDADLIYCNNKYYACFIDDKGGVTYELDSYLSRKTITDINSVRLNSVVNMDSPLFIGTTKSGVVITDCNGVYASLGIKDANINKVIKTGYNEFLIALSANGGTALSDTTGGSDIYLISVKL